MLKLENICYEADGKEILKDINLEERRKTLDLHVAYTLILST